MKTRKYPISTAEEFAPQASENELPHEVPVVHHGYDRDRDGNHIPFIKQLDFHAVRDGLFYNLNLPDALDEKIKKNEAQILCLFGKLPYSEANPTFRSQLLSLNIHEFLPQP